MDTSTPTFNKFDPTIIPYQYAVIDLVRRKWDYSKGILEIMLSGAVGSSKSLLMAHLGLTHCLLFDNARLMLGRHAMPDLKATIYKKILEHIGTELTEGVDYVTNSSTASILFRNGSEILSRSWADNNFTKVRSLELSAAIIEETIENDTREPYDEIKMRVGRLNHVPESWIVNATNPGSPGHWLFEYFIRQGVEHR